MSTKNIIIIAIIGVIAIFGIAVASMYFSYNNQEVELRQQAEAQRGKVEANFDAMWKIISQQAQVTDEYKEAFKEIYPALIEGRYSQGDGTLMKWIQESNPDFDASLYKTLMQTIEIQRISFTKDQARMLDIIREHKTLCETYPGKWFISNKTPIEYTIISSTKSKITMETGIDDDVDLFGKKD
ncbi:MAG: virion structural protein [Wendovervirus sonii]|uniref:Virion structural protein n=1 Tax=phage Lak_Megaphage_Sonny TaxID=3109229 RepID=A0ABZ0Z3T7_9CAUD|nr:MAG: virion structural protein [phage Lak_Megaphage_Sonny]